eukprot:CAMPEP_0198135612 /NCGR_PEP_ID=MMETSP1442-20131203/60679_1 /TAXON_ID= /ORGANISM="Craspedostauros australis, Strain CCMP3328" /LENGTH=187 /DNA_ID=CAMNT_0043796785 /DNA_START=62 /DNA_END=625 /DNA_ORIENTATION=+
MPSTNSTLLPPTLVSSPSNADDKIEFSLHTLPKQLLREFHHVFGDNFMQGVVATNTDQMELLAIPTNQQARQDLVAVGDHIEKEKDRLLNVFMGFGKQLCEALRALGFWADYIDPCSGLPMLSRGCNKVYSEVDGMECLLNYRSYNAGFCKILMHPKWGSAVYPATIFVYAPRDPVMRFAQQLISKP